ncbi:MAG: hypothetical protein Q8Q54_08130 [Methylococcales bacterium]|nr:hypothetical protein [Methylococcales bacterium]MDP3010528.1 hypothetical protein [Methylococcales bacterium]MDP3838873.1 hypothetical protein [Methylococcales bacterium]
MKQPYKNNLQRHNQTIKYKITCAFIFAAVFANPVFADSQCIEEAITLLKKTYPEQCQRNKLKVKLLTAHQNNDQLLLKELGGKLDELNNILKPTDEKLTVLKKSIKKNPDDEADFNTALLELNTCE